MNLPLQPSAASKLRLKGISAYGSACLAEGARLLTLALKELSPSAGQFLSLDDLNACKTARAAHAALTELFKVTQTLIKSTFALIPPLNSLEKTRQNQIYALSEAAGDALSYLQLAIQELGTPEGARKEGSFLAFIQTAQRLHELTVNSKGLFPALQRFAESSPFLTPSSRQTEISSQQAAAATRNPGRIPGIRQPLNNAHRPLIASYISTDYQLETSMPILDAFVLIGGRLVDLDAVTAGQYWQALSLPLCSSVTFDPMRHSILRLDGLSAGNCAIPIGLKYTPIAASAVLESGEERALSLSNCALSGRYRAKVPADLTSLKIQIMRNNSAHLPSMELWQRANPALAGTALPQHGLALARAVANSLTDSRLIYTQDLRIAGLFEAAGAHRLAVFDGLRAGNCETFAALLAHKLTQHSIGAVVIFGGVFDEVRGGIHCSPGHAQVLCAGGLFDLTAHTNELIIDASTRADSAILDAQAMIVRARDGLEAFQIAQQLGDEVIRSGEQAPPRNDGVRFEEIWECGETEGKSRGGNGSGRGEDPSDIEMQLRISLLSAQIDEPLRLVQNNQSVNWNAFIVNLGMCYETIKDHSHSPAVVKHFDSCGIAGKISLLFHEANVRGLVTSELAQHFVTCIGKWIEGTPLLGYAMIPAALELPDRLLRNAEEPLITRGPYGHIDCDVGYHLERPHVQRVLFLQLFEKLLPIEDSTLFREYARERLVLGTSLLSGPKNGAEYSQKAAELFGQVVKIAASSERAIYDILLKCVQFIDDSDLPEYLKQARRSPIARRWFNGDGSLSEYGRAKLTDYTLGELLRKPSSFSSRSSPLQLIATEQDCDEGDLMPVIKSFQLDLTSHRDLITRSVIAWIKHLKTSVGRLGELMPCPLTEAPFGAWLRYFLLDEDCIIAGVVNLQELGLINPSLLRQHWPLASEASAAKALTTTRIFQKSPNDYYLVCSDGPLEGNEISISLDYLAPTLLADWLDSGKIGSDPLGQIAAARKLLGVATMHDTQCQQWKDLYPDTWNALAQAVEKVPMNVLVQQTMKSLLDLIPDYRAKVIAITEELLNSLPFTTNTPTQALAAITAFLANIDRTSAASLNNLRQTTDITMQGAINDAEFLALTAVPIDYYQSARDLVNNVDFQSYFSAPQDWRRLPLFYAILDIQKLSSPPTATESRQIATLLTRAKRFAGQAIGQARMASSRVAGSRGQRGGGPNNAFSFERRNYTMGDDIRRIDWRTSARLDKLVVREFERDALYQQPRLEIHLDLQRLAQSDSVGVFAELTGVAELFFRYHTAIKLRLFFRGHELPVAGLPAIDDPRRRSESALISGFVTLARLTQNALKLSSIFRLPVPLYGNTPLTLTAVAQASQRYSPCQVLALPATANIHKTQLQIASCVKSPDFGVRVE